MRHHDTGQAQDWATRLSEALAATVPDAVLSVVGAGADRTCSAAAGARSCSITCLFAGRDDFRCSTTFTQGRFAVAAGRTLTLADTVAATTGWLRGLRHEVFHRQCPFVSWTKKWVGCLAAEIIDSCPALADLASPDVRGRAAEAGSVQFATGDRSCRLHHHPANPVPDSVFYWDGFLLFQMSTADADVLARVMGRWVRDRAMPSAVAAEFPSILMGGTAKYHEEGHPLEGEFLASWDQAEQAYRNWDEWMAEEPRILDFIGKLRAGGYDRVLRARTTETLDLELSRAKWHRPRQGQPFVVLKFPEAGGMDVHAHIVREMKFHTKHIGLTDNVRSLLTKLKRVEVE